jgi:hypothetical protein
VLRAGQQLHKEIIACDTLMLETFGIITPTALSTYLGKLCSFYNRTPGPPSLSQSSRLRVSHIYVTNAADIADARRSETLFASPSSPSAASSSSSSSSTSVAHFFGRFDDSHDHEDSRLGEACRRLRRSDVVLLPVLVCREYFLAVIHTHKRHIRMYARDGGGSSSSSDGGRGLLRAARVALRVVRRARGAGEKYACVRHEHRASVIPSDMGSALYACWAALYELSPPLRRVPPANMKAQVVEVLRQASQEAGPAGGGELLWRK